MPELPEVETVRRSLLPVLIGAQVQRVQVKRPDVIHSDGGRPSGAIRSRALLQGSTITELRRRGKQLAIISDAGPIVCVHLGMSGQLRFLPARTRLEQPKHVHCIWHGRSAAATGRLLFRDPRRFGGIWLVNSIDDLLLRWSALGPDALTISGRELATRLTGTRRPIKAALLDQRVLAGVGNIYADEALFRASVHPEAIASALPRETVLALAAAIRLTLREAVRAGGSTLRDYADANGKTGWFAVRHRVYGRGGQPCLRCGEQLSVSQTAQRTTVFCMRCQNPEAGYPHTASPGADTGS